MAPEYLDDLALAQRKWARLGSDDYSFTLRYGAGYEPTPPLRVIVRRDSIKSVTAIDTPTYLLSPYGYEGITIDELFENLRSAKYFGFKVVKVTYDPALGYPRTVLIDWDGVADDGNEISFSTSDLIFATFR